MGIRGPPFTLSESRLRTWSPPSYIIVYTVEGTASMQSRRNFIGNPATGLAGTLAMAVGSYRQQRTLRWDAAKKEVV